MNDRDRPPDEEESSAADPITATDPPRETGNEEGEPRAEQSMLEEETENADEAERTVEKQYEHADHKGGGHDHEGGRGGHEGGSHEGGWDHGDYGGMHKGHEEMFRRRFFVSTLLSISVLLYSETLQRWLGLSVPAFPRSEWINPVFAMVVFAYGGVLFLRMAIPELRDRSPGMMPLISMAISVAFVYSLASVVLPTKSAFF